MMLLDQQAQLNRALGHPTRVRILAMLRGGELCVCQVTAVLKLAYSTVSAHLAELRRTGLIDERKDGRWVYYRLGEGAEARRLSGLVLEAVDGDPQLLEDRRLLDRACCVSPAALCDLGLDLARILAPCAPTQKEDPR